MWEANHQEVEVAMYVRALVVAERPRATVPQRTLMIRFQEALGLSMPGLARNRWIIAGVNDAKRPQIVASASTKERVSAR